MIMIRDQNGEIGRIYGLLTERYINIHWETGSMLSVKSNNFFTALDEGKYKLCRNK